MNEPQKGQIGEGGAPNGVKAGSAPAGGTPTGSQPGDGGGNAGDANKGGGGEPTKKPDNLDDALKLIDVMSTLDDEKQEELDKTSTALDDLKSKIGKQGDIVAAQKKFELAAKNDPRGLIAQIAGPAGLKVSYGDAPAKLDLATAMASNDPETLKAALLAQNEQTKQEAVDQVRKELGPVMDSIMENQMLEKYPDFNELKDDRTLIQTKAMSGQLPWTEVFQMAAQGVNLAQAVTAAEKIGYDKGKNDALGKTNASHEDGGAKPADKGEAKHDKDDPEYLESVIHHLSKIT